MAYQRVNWLADLKRMARGQKPKAEAWLIAQLAADRLAAIPDGVTRTHRERREQSVVWLERLYRLSDPRS